MQIIVSRLIDLFNEGMGIINNIFWKNRRKVREFHISFIGSLFSGTAIGIFFAIILLFH